MRKTNTGIIIKNFRTMSFLTGLDWKNMIMGQGCKTLSLVFGTVWIRCRKIPEDGLPIRMQSTTRSDL